MGALLNLRAYICQVLLGVKVRPSLLHGRCVNGPSLFLNAAGSPHDQHNPGLVSVKGLRVNYHRFVTGELLFSTVPNSYIMKVARPLCLRVACSWSWINSAAVKRFSPALAVRGARGCCHFVSYCTLTYQMVFPPPPPLSFRCSTSPLCNLGIGCQFCDQATLLQPSGCTHSVCVRAHGASLSASSHCEEIWQLIDAFCVLFSFVSSVRCNKVVCCQATY